VGGIADEKALFGQQQVLLFKEKERMAALGHLTQYEYYATVDVCPLPHALCNDEEEQDDQPCSSSKKSHCGGHQPRKVFRFHPHHPLYHSHGQVLRAKQHTLIFNLQSSAPKYPGEPPT
jgi:hypothetical protein